MKKVTMFCGLLAAMLCLSVTASAQWSDDFDSYSLGPLTPQSTWEIWASGGSDATVTDQTYLSSPHSALITPATDVVHQYSGYTSGMWTYKAWVNVPSTYTGNGYFIMLDMYQPPSYQWCVQVWYDATDGNVHGNGGSWADTIIGPYTADEWGEIQVFYYFDDDWIQVFYNGHLLNDPTVADHPTLGPGYAISGGVGGGTGQQVALEAVDLYSDTGTEFYYDNLSLDVMDSWLDMKCNDSDGPVSVAAGDNVKLDYSLVAGINTGNAADIWIVAARQGGGYYSYDGNGPINGWWPDLNHAYATGPLANAFGTALDQAIPPGTYRAVIAIDTNANGRLDMGAIYAYDIVDFRVQ
jgi:hypothetical protein